MNFASAGSPTTSAAVRPDGALLSYQPYGKQGLLIADIDITAATGDSPTVQNHLNLRKN